ncbi:MAG TPA: hypothetical protein PK036_09985 [Geobacteraceae bacterium]|nr:hypothetical protein [Geobacteraceae bacterium]
MQSNESGYSIDFINRDVKDFPATVTKETIPSRHLEDIAMVVILALIVLACLVLFFSAPPQADGLEEKEQNGERQPAVIA